MKKISIIVPAYNESESINYFYQEISKIFDNNKYKYEVIFVDDGSKDNTLLLIKNIAKQDDRIFFIELSRNFGHQKALKAGIDKAKGDCLISLDCDLQQPPSLIPTMIEKWEEGYDIVYTIRKEDKRLPLFKRVTSQLFYKIINKLSDVEIENGSADFRLIDSSVAEKLREINETDIFIRGIVKWLGFKQYSIEYQPDKRFAGNSKYSLNKMISFAISGITSFSIKPLYFVVYMGISFALLSLLYIPYVLYSMFMGHTVDGWVSLVVTIVFFSGLNLFLLGIVGIYLGKTFMESKQRPLYVIRDSNIFK